MSSFRTHHKWWCCRPALRVALQWLDQIEDYICTLCRWASMMCYTAGTVTSRYSRRTPLRSHAQQQPAGQQHVLVCQPVSAHGYGRLRWGLRHAHRLVLKAADTAVTGSSCTQQQQLRRTTYGGVCPTPSMRSACSCFAVRSSSRCAISHDVNRLGRLQVGPAQLAI
jgi:hypothetical protein